MDFSTRHSNGLGDYSSEIDVGPAVKQWVLAIKLKQ